MIEPSVNIASHLSVMADRQPHRAAVVVPAGKTSSGRRRYCHATFARLDEESSHAARGLHAVGIGPGTRTVLMVSPSVEFFALTFALFKAGAVPIMIDPGMGLKNVGKCLEEAMPQAFVGIPKAHVARRLFGWAKQASVKVTVGGPRWLGGFTYRDLLREGQRQTGAAVDVKPEDTAAVLFTSGSTGVPKGVVYTHRIFDRQLAMLKEIYGIEPGEIDLPTFPLFALFAPGLGMTAIIPDMDPTRPARVNPENIFQAIHDFGATNMFGSPALIHRVGRYGAELGVKLPTLRRVISAGAPVPAAVLRRFCELLSPGVEVFTPYGATESLPVCSIGSDEILSDTCRRTDEGAGVCVGRPVNGVRLHVLKITDDPIPTWSDELLAPPGEIGEIVVQGDNVTRTYFNREQSTKLAKIDDPATGGFFHRMGDLGYLDDQGRVWFCGRKAHRVQAAKQTLYTIPCEGVFNTHPAVYRSALVGVDNGAGTHPVLCVELEDAKATDRTSVRTELLELAGRYEHTKGIRSIHFHPSFPVDIRHNAKIFREKLAVWAQKQAARR